ncbi:MAG: SBBP repeat-containing protein [Chitinophagaceae bacterium]|nr:SBBP repeat-containing protein [Chitinophagaceae bacterium]
MKQLKAQPFHSGFPLAHDTYNALSAASDGKIYYVLSSQSIDTGGQMYSYDPRTNKIHFCGDLTEACGEKGAKSISQGKSHVRFAESKGKLYFATHAGYYSMVDGMEKMGIAPEGYKPYPGGHFLSYDLKTGKFEDLGIAPHGEGVLTMNMDTARGLIYAITWPVGYFVVCDVKTKTIKEITPVSGEGENGVGAAFRTLCRSIAIYPKNGAVYLTNSEGAILKYMPGADRLVKIDEDMKKDYFGLYDPSSPGHMGYNWRQVIWSPNDKCFYGVHGNSGYLFKFNPATETITVMERITSEPSKASGMFDQFSYGYLGFILGPDNRTLYYLTGGPIYENGKRVKGKDHTAMGEAKGVEDLHLVTYDIVSKQYTDHGAAFYPNGQRPLYVNSIAVDKNGNIYTLARITEDGHMTADLVKIERVVSGKK